MKLVADTSPLIFLAKLKKLAFLDSFEVMVPATVFSEIEAGRRAGKEDVACIERWLARKKTPILDAPFIPELSDILGKGEISVISLALKEHITTVLIDEKKARAYARLYSLQPRGTLSVVVQLHKAGAISTRHCKDLIFALLKQGYRIKEEQLLELLNSLT